MKETLETINRMQADGVIGKYAIGGIVADTFYLEPAATLEIDVLVTPALEGQSLSLDYRLENEPMIIGGWPIRFLAPINSLETEALSGAFEADAGGVRTWVITAEHLVAIALQTERPQNFSRIIRFLDHQALVQSKLDDILARHGLMAKWEKFRNKFLEGLETVNEKPSQFTSLCFDEKLKLLEKLRERSLILIDARKSLNRRNHT